MSITIQTAYSNQELAEIIREAAIQKLIKDGRLSATEQMVVNCNIIITLNCGCEVEVTVESTDKGLHIVK